IVQYYGRHRVPIPVCYTTQPKPDGLCDAVFRALPFMQGSNDDAMIGLPDTIWFPEDALCALPPNQFSLLLFPVLQPENFDAVSIGDKGSVQHIWVKERGAPPWIWGAMRSPVATIQDLHRLWLKRERVDQYLGTLINAYIEDGGEVFGVPAGVRYLDVGTI